MKANAESCIACDPTHDGLTFDLCRRHRIAAGLSAVRTEETPMHYGTKDHPMTEQEWRNIPAGPPAQSGWKPGDPCGVCGSTSTTQNAVDGGCCAGCGATDADDD